MQEKKLNLKPIETKLEGILYPVTPRPAFVLALRQRLDEEMAQRIKKAKMKQGLLVVGGLVGGILMIVTVIRSLTSWPEFTKTIDEWFSKPKKGHQLVSA